MKYKAYATSTLENFTKAQEILFKHGFTWAEGGRDIKTQKFSVYKEDTVICVCSLYFGFGSVDSQKDEFCIQTMKDFMEKYGEEGEEKIMDFETKENIEITRKEINSLIGEIADIRCWLNGVTFGAKNYGDIKVFIPQSKNIGELMIKLKDIQNKFLNQGGK